MHDDDHHHHYSCLRRMDVCTYIRTRVSINIHTCMIGICMYKEEKKTTI